MILGTIFEGLIIKTNHQTRNLVLASASNGKHWCKANKQIDSKMQISQVSGLQKFVLISFVLFHRQKSKKMLM
jgi:hypothetical protein